MMIDEAKERVLVSEQYAIVSLPENAVEVTITAKIYQGGKLSAVSKTLSMKEIQTAFHEAKTLDYIPPDAVFTLTEEGRKWLEELEDHEED